MERSLRSFASSLALLCGTALPGLAQEAPPPAPADDALCETGVVENLALDAAQRSHCHALWQSRIEEARRRSKAHIQRIIEENRLRRESEASLPPPPPSPVTVENFIDAGDLAYGDVVVTGKGPRVFIGKGEGPSTPDDFVALDSPLSPHRGNITPYAGAFPGQRRAQPPRPRQPPSKSQERQP